MLSIEIDKRDLERIAKELGQMPKTIPTVLMRSVNRCIAPAKRAIAEGMQSVTTIKNKSRVVKDVTERRATKDNPSAKLTFKGRAVGAIQFEHTLAKDGTLSVRFGKNDTPVKFRGVFKGTGLGGGAGNRHLWYRKGGAKHKVEEAHYKPNIGRKMQKIAPVKGPRLKTVYERNPQIRTAAEKVVAEVLSKNILSQIDAALGRSKADRPA